MRIRKFAELEAAMSPSARGESDRLFKEALAELSRQEDEKPRPLPDGKFEEEPALAGVGAG